MLPEFFLINRMGFPNIDLFMLSSHTFLFYGEYLLKEFLPRPDPAILDLYILFRFKTGKANQIMRQIHYPYGFAHIKDKYFSLFSHCPGLYYQGDRFRNGHEISPHFRMSDRYRTAGGDLFFKKRDNTTPAAQNISKP